MEQVTAGGAGEQKPTLGGAQRKHGINSAPKRGARAEKGKGDQALHTVPKKTDCPHGTYSQIRAFLR